MAEVCRHAACLLILCSDVQIAQWYFLGICFSLKISTFLYNVVPCKCIPSTVSIFVQVNAKYEDRAALHQAAGIGNIPLTKLLLEFGATVDIEVCALRTDLL